MKEAPTISGAKQITRKHSEISLLSPQSSHRRQSDSPLFTNVDSPPSENSSGLSSPPSNALASPTEIPKSKIRSSTLQTAASPPPMMRTNSPLKIQIKSEKKPQDTNSKQRSISISDEISPPSLGKPHTESSVLDHYIFFEKLTALHSF